VAQRVSSGRWAHRAVGSTCVARVGGPASEPGVQRVGLAAIVRLGERNQSVAVESSLSRMAPL
jgi:hypothetical protein